MRLGYRILPPNSKRTLDTLCHIGEERLGKDFEKVLYDNLWDLYSR